MRNGLSALMLLVLACQSAFGQEVSDSRVPDLQPRKTCDLELTSLRKPLIAKLGTIVCPGEVSFELRVLNKLEFTLTPESSEKSCNCFAGIVNKGEVQKDQPLLVNVTLNPVAPGRFVQQFKIFDKNENLAPLVVQLEAEVVPIAKLNESQLDLKSSGISHHKLKVIPRIEGVVFHKAVKIHCRSAGTKCEIASTSEHEVCIDFEVDSDKVFKGNPNESCTLFIERVMYAGKESSAELNVRLDFVDVVYCKPSELVFFQRQDGLSSRTAIIGSGVGSRVDHIEVEFSNREIASTATILSKNERAVYFETRLNSQIEDVDFATILLQPEGLRIRIPVRFETTPLKESKEKQ